VCACAGQTQRARGSVFVVASRNDLSFWGGATISPRRYIAIQPRVIVVPSAGCILYSTPCDWTHLCRRSTISFSFRALLCSFRFLLGCFLRRPLLPFALLTLLRVFRRWADAAGTNINTHRTDREDYQARPGRAERDKGGHGAHRKGHGKHANQAANIRRATPPMFAAATKSLNRHTAGPVPVDPRRCSTRELGSRPRHGVVQKRGCWVRWDEASSFVTPPLSFRLSPLFESRRRAQAKSASPFAFRVWPCCPGLVPCRAATLFPKWGSCTGL